MENRFSKLPLDSPDIDDPKVSKTNPAIKLSPIILYDFNDVIELTKLIETLNDKNQFKYKIINKILQLHILVTIAEEYKNIINLIRTTGVIRQTF